MNSRRWVVERGEKGKQKNPSKLLSFATKSRERERESVNEFSLNCGIPVKLYKGFTGY